jgi:hypothetical protein
MAPSMRPMDKKIITDAPTDDKSAPVDEKPATEKLRQFDKRKYYQAVDIGEAILTARIIDAKDINGKGFKACVKDIVDAYEQNQLGWTSEFGKVEKRLFVAEHNPIVCGILKSYKSEEGEIGTAKPLEKVVEQSYQIDHTSLEALQAVCDGHNGEVAAFIEVANYLGGLIARYGNVSEIPIGLHYERGKGDIAHIPRDGKLISLNIDTEVTVKMLKCRDFKKLLFDIKISNETCNPDGLLGLLIHEYAHKKEGNWGINADHGVSFISSIKCLFRDFYTNAKKDGITEEVLINNIGNIYNKYSLTPMSIEALANDLAGYIKQMPVGPGGRKEYNMFLTGPKE